MAAKRARTLAKKKSVASSPKLAPKVAKAAPKKKAAPSAKSAPAKASPAKSAPAKLSPAKSAPKKAAPPAAKASAPGAKKPVPKKAAPKAKETTAVKAAKAPKPAAAKAPKPAAAKAPKPAAANGLSVGDAVPALDLSDHEGNPFSLSSLAGQSYVLYFYPKDDTPGCTREACAFRDDMGKFEGQGVRIIGVSPDKPESHERFRAKYGLPFTLLSDADKLAANAFGVWVKKQNYGREYMGIERSTFFVDADGKVKKVWRNVKVDGHAQAVFDAAAS